MEINILSRDQIRKHRQKAVIIICEKQKQKLIEQ